jgi:hypothetical protein
MLGSSPFKLDSFFCLDKLDIKKIEIQMFVPESTSPNMVPLLLWRGLLPNPNLSQQPIIEWHYKQQTGDDIFPSVAGDVDDPSG